MGEEEAWTLRGESVVLKISYLPLPTSSPFLIPGGGKTVKLKIFCFTPSEILKE
jgi:hypothetical protein